MTNYHCVFLGILAILITILLIYVYKKNEHEKEKYCGCDKRFKFPYQEYASLPEQGLLRCNCK